MTPPHSVPDPCFICLDEGTAESSVQILNFGIYREIPCSCQVSCHMQCWTAYYVKKGGFECPICHCKIIASPLALAPQPEQPQMVIVVRPSDTPIVNINRRSNFYILVLFCIIVSIILILRIL